MRDCKGLGMPVYILELEARDLAGAHPIRGKQLKDGIIATPLNGPVSPRLPEHGRDIRRFNDRWNRLVLIHGR